MTKRTIKDIRWAATLPQSSARDELLAVLVDKHIAASTRGSWATKAIVDPLVGIWEGLKDFLFVIPDAIGRCGAAIRGGGKS